MFAETQIFLPCLCAAVLILLGVIAWNYLSDQGPKKLGDWSPNAFLRTSSKAGASAFATSADPWWLQELEIIGVATAGESVALST
jgi:hypothetical protein